MHPPTTQANPTDFLNGQPEATEMSGLISAMGETFSPLAKLLGDIRRETMKVNPNVLAFTVCQGAQNGANQTILSGDSSSKRVTFQIGGKQVPIYRLAAWAVIGGGHVGLSPVSMGAGATAYENGIQLGTTPTILQLALDEVYLCTDGSADFGVNDPSATDKIWVLGWTIPDYERERDMPNLNVGVTDAAPWAVNPLA